MTITTGITHTPGPWKYLPNGRGWNNLCGGDGRSVWDHTESESAANRALIAAAPELLSALKGLLADIDAGLLVRNIDADVRPEWTRYMVDFVTRLHAANAAITKAEGR